MLELVTRGLAALLLVGAGLHAWGSLLAFPARSPSRVWALGSAGFATLLAVLGWLVAGRDDPTLALVVAIGCLGWVVTVAAFGRAIGTLTDPRVIYHLVVGAGLGVAVLI